MKEVNNAQQYSRQIRNCLVFAAVVLFLFVIKAASEVTLPVALALFIFAFVNPLMDRMSRLKVPNVISIILCMALIFVIFFGFLYILFLMVNMILDRMPYYASRVVSLDKNFSSELAEHFPELGEEFSVLSMIDVDWYGLAMNSLTSFSSQIISVLTFALPRDKSQKFASTMGRINRQMTKYLMLKAVISLLTGFLYYLTAIVTNLDFALVWGVLAMLLNFIPTIGSIVVTVGTIIMAIIQFMPQWGYIIYVGIIMVSIEMVIGNIIDPKLQGVQLNISPIMILVSLAFWGYIWGLVGMFLAVPLTSMMQIVCANIPALKPVAIFLSTGKFLSFGRKEDKKGRRRKKESSEDDESFDVEMPIGKNPDEADDDFLLDFPFLARAAASAFALRSASRRRRASSSLRRRSAASISC